MTDPLIGVTVSHYCIQEKLGGGGMGVVYRAEDALLPRHVALKFLSKELEADPDAVARFRREARAASSLNHPHICTIHDIGEFEGHPFLVMELLEGQTLRDRISAGPFRTEEIASLGIQLTEALDSAHAKGIVHRDIKPSNVFLTRNGQVKLLDFGLARRLRKDDLEGSTRSHGPLTEQSTVAGTLFYLAPEVLGGESADSRSDLWALGVVLYEMAAGRRPFAGQTLFQVTSAILREPPRSLPEGVPDGLHAVILRCLAKNPSERYQRANETRAALETISSSRSILPDEQKATAEGESIHSVAVMPFQNESNDPETDYLSWGITESIIYSLGQLEKLHVAPVSSVHRYKGQNLDPRLLGRELNVGAVLTGRVAARGDTLVVGTELVDTRSGWQIWGRQYTRKASDVVSIHEEIAREISEGLRLSLTRDETKLLEKRSTDDPAAYQLYLKGRFCFNSKSAEGLHRALRNFKLATGRDPGFALAQVGVADAYSWLGFFGVLPPLECFPNAQEAESQALEIDATLSEAHAVKAFVAFQYQWEMALADKEYRRAIELNPKYPVAHFWYAWYLTAMERIQEAEAEMAEAQRMEPNSLLVSTYAAFASYLAHRYDAAIDNLRRVLEKVPGFAVAQWWLGLACIEKGDYEAALEALQKSVQYSGADPAPMAALGHLYGRLGWSGDVRKIREQLVELSAKRYVSAFNFAQCQSCRNEKEQTLEWLEKACEERSSLLVYLKVWPMFDPLRSEPRFQAVVKRVGLAA
jgi:serine/threonine protein kinase/tetratricopeptide (TPR) repeat protein